MTLKEARKECRNRALKWHRDMWPLCWNKANEYYPASSYEGDDIYRICYIDKNGTAKYFSKENKKLHNL